MKTNKSNLKITVVCKDLEFEMCNEIHSSKIEKWIKKHQNPKPKARITCSSKTYILMMYDLWKKGMLVVPGGNGIEALSKFIYGTCHLTQESNPQKDYELSSIKSELYKLDD